MVSTNFVACAGVGVPLAPTLYVSCYEQNTDVLATRDEPYL
jgi:hypothetical protein